MVRPTPKSCTLVSPLEILGVKIGTYKMIIFVSFLVSKNDFVASMLLGVTVPYSMLARAIIFTCDGLHSLAGCGVGGGGCGGGNQITQQIESHHLSIHPSVSFVRPFVPRNLLFISLYLLGRSEFDITDFGITESDITNLI